MTNLEYRKLEDLPTKADDKIWNTVASSRFATLPQIVEPPPVFFRSVKYVNAPAVYSDQGIAMRLQSADRGPP